MRVSKRLVRVGCVFVLRGWQKSEMVLEANLMENWCQVREIREKREIRGFLVKRNALLWMKHGKGHNGKEKMKGTRNKKRK